MAFTLLSTAASQQESQGSDSQLPSTVQRHATEVNCKLLYAISDSSCPPSSYSSIGVAIEGHLGRPDAGRSFSQ